MSKRDAGSVCPECTALQSRIESLEAQLSALRDQQPVACDPDHFPNMGDAGVKALRKHYPHASSEIAREVWIAMLATLYAHPSCVSPDKPQPPEPAA